MSVDGTSSCSCWVCEGDPARDPNLDQRKGYERVEASDSARALPASGRNVDLDTEPRQQ